MCLKLESICEPLNASNYGSEITSSDPMKGAIVSGSSGAIAPKEFQFFVNPSLILLACSAEVVRLYKIAIEFASWGQSVVVSLSRNIPRDGSQKTSLKRDFKEVAFAAHVEESEESFTAVAKSTLFVRTYVLIQQRSTMKPSQTLNAPYTTTHFLPR